MKLELTFWARFFHNSSLLAVTIVLVEKCRYLPSVPNGRVTYSTVPWQTDYQYFFRDTVATYHCNDLYRVSGSNTRTCGYLGWEGEAATCVRGKDTNNLFLGSAYTEWKRKRSKRHQKRSKCKRQTSKKIFTFDFAIFSVDGTLGLVHTELLAMAFTIAIPKGGRINRGTLPRTKVFLFTSSKKFAIFVWNVKCTLIKKAQQMYNFVSLSVCLPSSVRVEVRYE